MPEDKTRNQQKRILIVYSSGYGSTADVARFIGDQLIEKGAAVTVKSLPLKEKMSHYDAIIIGSAIRYDRWMKEARKFVKTNEQLLSKLPVAYFFNCLTLARKNEESLKHGQQYANKIFRLSDTVKPVSIGQFGGVLDFSKMPFILRIPFKLMSLKAGLTEGDYRNWQEISEWTNDLAEKLVI